MSSPCPAHPGQTLVFVCTSPCDRVALCDACVEPHAAHVIDALVDTATASRLALSRSCDLFVDPLVAARAYARSLDSAISSVQAAAESARIGTEAWLGSHSDLHGASIIASDLNEAIAGAEAAKVAGLEEEQVAADAVIEAAESVIAEIRAVLSKGGADAAVVSSHTSLNARLAAALASLRALPAPGDPPSTDVTIELDPPESPASPPKLFIASARPVVPAALTPGLIVLTAHPQRGGRRAMVIECADPSRILLVIEDAAEGAQTLEEASAAVASDERFPHPSNSSWSGCGGNPSGQARCSGSGNCAKRIGCSPEGCGAGTRHTCCGSSVRSSEHCLPGVTRGQAITNAAAIAMEHDFMRCDEVPDVLYPPAAYDERLALVAPPATYGTRLVAPVESLLAVPPHVRLGVARHH